MLHRPREERITLITLPRVIDHPWFSQTDVLWFKKIARCEIYETVGVTRISRSGSEMKWSAGIHEKELDQGVPVMVRQREEAVEALQNAIEHRNGSRGAGDGRPIIESRAERMRRAGAVLSGPPRAGKRMAGREQKPSAAPSRPVTGIRPSYSLLV
jgi:hypothetical protein